MEDWCLACQHGAPNTVSYWHCPGCHRQGLEPGRHTMWYCDYCIMSSKTTIFRNTDGTQDEAEAAES